MHGQLKLYSSFVVLWMIFLLFCVGCGEKKVEQSVKVEQPVIKNPKAEPAVINLAKDREVFVSVEVYDPQEKIGIIELTFPNYSGAPEFTLNDKGRDNDREAGDGIWSVNIPLPPPESLRAGEYQMLFKCIGKDNLPIKVISSEGAEKPLTVESILRIL